MATTVGAFEAKTHLSSLLDRVELGETITITRHGEPVAVLAPVQEKKKLTHDEIMAGMRELRKRTRPGKMTLKELIEEGRRY